MSRTTRSIALVIFLILCGPKCWAQFEESESEQVRQTPEEDAQETKDESKPFSDFLSFAVRLTHLYQDPSDSDISSEHDGKFDVTMKLDLHGLGWWHGANFVLKGEANYGNSIKSQGPLGMKTAEYRLRCRWS